LEKSGFSYWFPATAKANTTAKPKPDADFADVTRITRIHPKKESEIKPPLPKILFCPTGFIRVTSAKSASGFTVSYFTDDPIIRSPDSSIIPPSP
jgi:hypothetical protein